MVPPTVGAVVTVGNDRSDIVDCLAALRAQEHALAEIVAVDCGSTDGSTALVTAQTVRIVNRALDDGDALDVGRHSANCEVTLIVPARARLAPDALARAMAGGDSDGSSIELRLRPLGSTTFGRAVATLVPDFTVEASRRAPRSESIRRVDSAGWWLVPETPRLWAKHCFQHPDRGRALSFFALPALLVILRRWPLAVAAAGAHTVLWGRQALRAGRKVGVTRRHAFVAAMLRDGSSAMGWYAGRRPR